MEFPRFTLVLSLAVFFGTISFAQVTTFPYVERFDSVSTPALPLGWSTSANRAAAGDFFSTTTSPHSPPYAVQSTNSTIPQHILSPLFDFSDRIPHELAFWIARSGTHTSPLIIEASNDSGLSYSFMLGDTLRNPGTTGYNRTVLSLPEFLFNRPAVRFRWRLLGGTGGSAGTFRMDDVELSILTSYDLVAGRLMISPVAPTTNDPISISLAVHNEGALSSPQAEILFFLDSDGNRNADPQEQFRIVSLNSLLPGDSTTVTVSHPPLSQGSHRFLGVVSFAQDERHSNDTAEIELNVGVAAGSIVVNEIMYAPTGDEPEWVELFNATGDTINIRNWRISDSNTSTKTVITRSDVPVPPRSYHIIADDSLFLAVHPNIPVTVSFADFSALNNTSDDAVVIYDERLATVDSMRYFPSWGGGAGRSLERSDASASSVDPANWSASVDSTGSTPGRPNSTVRHAFDLALGECTISGELLSIIVTNVGKEAASSYLVRLFADRNRNGLPDEAESTGSIPSSGSLPPRGSAFLSFNWSHLPPGETMFIIVIDFPPDQRSSNNVKSVILQKRFPQNALVINEIMYEPLSGKGEWFELFNAGDDAVDLKRWSFSEGAGSAILITDSSIIVPAAGFALVSSDTTIFDFSYTQNVPVVILKTSGGFGLGNEGDDLILRDGTGTTIDSVRYSPEWHQPAVTETRGRSLERINPELGSNDPRNWSTSAAGSGGSPGTRNTIFTSHTPFTGTLSFSPNPFSPDGDGHEDFCLISYRLPRTTALIRLTVFDLRGRVIRTLADSDLSGDHGEILWDGMDDQRRRARIGPYVVLFEAVDGVGNSVETMKGVIVVATKL